MEGHEYNSIVLSLEKKESARWIFQGNAENQFSYDDIIQAHVDNRVGAVPVAFRIFLYKYSNGAKISSLKDNKTKDVNTNAKKTTISIHRMATL